MKIKMVILAIILSILLILPATSYKADIVDTSYVKGESNEIETAIINDGNTLYVGGSGPNNYTKIQDAIDAASDGDTIFVYSYSSPYHENLVINKELALLLWLLLTWQPLLGLPSRMAEATGLTRGLKSARITTMFWGPSSSITVLGYFLIIPTTIPFLVTGLFLTGDTAYFLNTPRPICCATIIFCPPVFMD